MAKALLWVFVITGIIASAIDDFRDEPVTLYTKVVVLSAIGILAICESIEKGKSK